MTTKVQRDNRGFYVRTNGTVYRPQPTKHSYAVRLATNGVTRLDAGQPVSARAVARKRIAARTAAKATVETIAREPAPAPVETATDASSAVQPKPANPRAENMQVNIDTKCCDTCKYFSIPLTSTGRPKKNNNGHCTFNIGPVTREIQEIIASRVPEALNLTLQQMSLGISPDDGENCPCYERKV